MTYDKMRQDYERMREAEKNRIVDEWKAANGYDDLLAAYAKSARDLAETRAFLHRTAMTGGSIVSSAAMTAQQIAIARAADRMLVTPDGHGFVYVPGPRFCVCGRIESDCDQSRASCPMTDHTSEDIARLRADLERSQSKHRHTMHVMDGMQEEIAKLRAARLRPETVKVIRRALLGEITAAWTPEDADSSGLAMDDIDRCYPEEE